MAATTTRIGNARLRALATAAKRRVGLYLDVALFEKEVLPCPFDFAYQGNIILGAGQGPQWLEGRIEKAWHDSHECEDVCHLFVTVNAGPGVPVRGRPGALRYRPLVHVRCSVAPPGEDPPRK